MNELVLGAAFLASLVFGHLERRAAAQERQRLMNAVVAQSPAEFVALEAAARPKKTPKKDPDAGMYDPIGI